MVRYLRAQSQITLFNNIESTYDETVRDNMAYRLFCLHISSIRVREKSRLRAKRHVCPIVFVTAINPRCCMLSCYHLLQYSCLLTVYFSKVNRTCRKLDILRVSRNDWLLRCASKLTAPCFFLQENKWKCCSCDMQKHLAIIWNELFIPSGMALTR
jgi:hypothetical protein